MKIGEIEGERGKASRLLSIGLSFRPRLLIGILLWREEERTSMGESFSTTERGALPLKGLIPAIFPPEMQKMESFYRRDAPISVPYDEILRQGPARSTKFRIPTADRTIITKRPFTNERLIEFYGSLILGKM